MKKLFGAFFLLTAFLPLLCACSGIDYEDYLSESREDVFLAQTESFSLTVSCTSREYPYVSDGIACPKSKVVEVSLIPLDPAASDYEIYLPETGIGGEMSFRTYAGDYFFSEGVESFPQNSVSVKIVCGGETSEVRAGSVKNDKTLSVSEALSRAVRAEKKTVDALTQNGNFLGEFYVRLLRRDANYYYVGIVSRDGTTISLLLAGESGEILARRVSDAANP